ncbi:MAG: hypothetical protein EOO54_15990 [Haliea sp.]|nr:MAG: hypothetical protein EOO54_15990 [Haliea sp.]
MPGLRAAAVASLSCLLIAGCGGGSSGDVGGATARGDRAASAAVPLIAAPDPEKCAQTGTAVQGSPLLNSQLDCAP